VLAAALKIAVVAFSLGLDVFAVSVGVGMRGAERALKIRIGAAFATAEVAMTLIGVGLGSVTGRLIGEAAAYLGFAALVAVGAYMIYESYSAGEKGLDLSQGWGLFIGALSVSMDSLGIGFSILFLGVPLVVCLICIAAASVVSTSVGLALGKALGARVEEAAGIWAGIILVVTGLAFGGFKLLHLGV
jgi:putative Mn2+ efflux pump MntP